MYQKTRSSESQPLPLVAKANLRAEL